MFGRMFARVAGVVLAVAMSSSNLPHRRPADAVPAAAAAGGSQVDGQIEPRAGTWKTWVLASPGQFRLPAPPDRAATEAELKTLRDLATRRDGPGRIQIEFWNAGGPLYRWDRIALDESLNHLINNNRGPRALALVSVAMYDAIIAAWDSKYTYNRPRPSMSDPALTTALPTPRSPSYPSEQAVVAGAASAVLAYLFPDDAARLSSLADEDGKTQLLAGIEYPSDVSAGLELGRKVAALVIERARGDGSDAVFNGQIPKGPGYWNGTDPIEPMMGTWKTWVLTSGAQFRPGPPPAYDSEQKKAEIVEIKTFVRTPKSNDAAFFWQYAVAGTRGYHWWHEQVAEQIALHGLDTNPPRAARAYALESVAQLRCHGGVLGWQVHVLGDPALPARPRGENALSHPEPSQLSGGPRMSIRRERCHPGLPVSIGGIALRGAGRAGRRVADLGRYSLPQRRRRRVRAGPQGGRSCDRACPGGWVALTRRSLLQDAVLV